MDALTRDGRSLPWLVAGAAVGSVQVVASVATPSTALAHVLGAVLGPLLLALGATPRRPLLAPSGAMAVVVASVMVQPDINAAAAFFAVCVVAFALGVELAWRPLLVGVAWTLTAIALAQSRTDPQGHSRLGSFLFAGCLLVGLPLFVGRVVRARARLIDALHDSNARLERLRAARVAETVAQDRQRVAAKVDAVVLHGLRELAEHATVSGVESLLALEDRARATLEKMRGLLTSIRDGVDTTPPPVETLRARVGAAVAAETSQDPTAAAVPRRHLPSTGEVDVVLLVLGAALVVAAAIGGGQTAAPGREAAGVLLAGLVVLPVTVARRLPLASVLVSAAALVAWGAWARPDDPLQGFAPTAPLLVLPFAAAVVLQRRPASAAALALCAGTLGCVALDPAATFRHSQPQAGMAIAIAAWAAGRAVRAQQLLVRRLAGSLVAVETEVQVAAADQISRDRLRLAGELHDAVAHAMTVVALQAAAARRVWSRDPALARQHVETLERTVREALDELRPVLLAVPLEVTDAEEALPRLVQRARDAGLDIHVSGELRDPEDEDASRLAYRVVREALTNAARHAPGAATEVQVHRSEGEIRVAVVNGPAADSVRPLAHVGSGHGLSGLREAVVAAGGRLHAESDAGGGFAVRAALPEKVSR